MLVVLGLMNLAFSTRDLRTICEEQIAAEREFGIEIAHELRARLADMRAAENVSELVAGRPREIVLNDDRLYVVDIAKGYRIVLRANNLRIRQQVQGKEIDWSQVDCVQIINVEKEPASA